MTSYQIILISTLLSTHFTAYYIIIVLYLPSSILSLIILPIQCPALNTFLGSIDYETLPLRFLLKI